ncbi:ATP-binding protein [Lacticaseibacillus thailandensis]|nr:ATP-binding protein [Lacticaseibacillus thailandensis]
MAQIRVAGKIIREISEQIPNGQLAMTKLIKNAYEANANSIKISINTVGSDIIIRDDGSGMNDNEIGSLLNLSHSDKIFGSKVNGRYVSGEKGLGFFSAFKFGRMISVDTSDPDDSSIKRSFKLDMAEIGKTSDVSNLDVPVEKSTNNKGKGTIIRITRLNVDAVKLFCKSLSQAGFSSRLTNIIDDTSFSINILVDGVHVADDYIENDKFKQARIATISLLGPDEVDTTGAVLVCVGHEKSKIQIPQNIGRILNTKHLKLWAEISVYRLQGLGIDYAPKIYLFDDHKLHPLVYINDSLFEGEGLYNVEVNASGKTNRVFRQQTGKISLYLDKPDILSFNADRTRIIDSTRLRELKALLDFISSEGQSEVRRLIDLQSKSHESSQTVHGDATGVDGPHHNEKADGSHLQTEGEGATVGGKTEPGRRENGATAKLLLDTVEVGQPYEFDKLIELKDSQGGQSVKPSEVSFQPSDRTVYLDSDKETVVFTHYGEVTITFDYWDKITQKKSHFCDSVTVKRPKRLHHKKNDVWVYPLLDTDILDGDVESYIIDFTNQVNLIANDDKLDLVFVSSLRTFAELMIRSIAKTESANKDGLKETYNAVMGDANFNKALKRSGICNKSVKALQTIHRLVKEQKFVPIIDFLNLATHNATKLVTAKDVRDKSIYFKFLLTYTYIANMGNKHK